MKPRPQWIAHLVGGYEFLDEYTELCQRYGLAFSVNGKHPTELTAFHGTVAHPLATEVISYSEYGEQVAYKEKANPEEVKALMRSEDEKLLARENTEPFHYEGNYTPNYTNG